MRCIPVYSSEVQFQFISTTPVQGLWRVITRQYIVWHSFLWRGAVALLRPGRSNEIHSGFCRWVPKSAAFLKMPYSTCMLVRFRAAKELIAHNTLFQTEASEERRLCTQ